MKGYNQVDFQNLSKDLQNDKLVDKKEFCEIIFPSVSRTFAINVVRLPEPLRFQVLVSYLLCRIADTVEDDEALSSPRKKDLLQQFARILQKEKRDSEYDKFEQSCRSEIVGEKPDILLLHNSKYVLDCFYDFSEGVRLHIYKWVNEMAQGMAEYAGRKTQEDDVTFLESLKDLEKYCYYVAGTVGHLLSGLFFHHYNYITKHHYDLMEKQATSFGVGLQLTNIIKDSVVDYKRGWCYLPSDMIQDLSLNSDNFTSQTHRSNAYELMHSIIKRAKDHLDNALVYSCTLPRRALRVRIFCFLPLMMAIKTLEKAVGNEGLFNADNPVKISREEVIKIIRYTRFNVWSNMRMIKWYKRVAKSLEKKLQTV